MKAHDGRLVARIPQPRMWDAVADADRVHPVAAPWEALPDDGSPVPPSALWQNRPRTLSAPTIRLDPLPTARATRAAEQLCQHLTATATTYPGTQTTIRYEIKHRP